MLVMDLFEALRCYFESRNVALSSVDEIREIMLAPRGWIPLESLNGQQRRTASLLWLAGLLNVVVAGVVGGRPRLAGYRLSRVGRVYVGLLRDSPMASDLFLAEVLAGWAPMRNLLIYSLGRRTVTVDGVERDLGSQIEEATGRAFALLRAFGILRRGAPVKKPYNRACVEALLFRLGRELGLYSRTRSEVELTGAGRAYS